MLTGCNGVSQTEHREVPGLEHHGMVGAKGVTQGDGGPAKDMLGHPPRRVPALLSRCIIDPSCSAEHLRVQGGERCGVLRGWVLLGSTQGAGCSMGSPQGAPNASPPVHLSGHPIEGPTCHGMGDDSDEQALVPHLDTHVGVLHADDHPLHLLGKHLPRSAPCPGHWAWALPGFTHPNPGTLCLEQGQQSTPQHDPGTPQPGE